MVCFSFFVRNIRIEMHIFSLLDDTKHKLLSVSEKPLGLH